MNIFTNPDYAIDCVISLFLPYEIFQLMIAGWRMNINLVQITVLILLGSPAMQGEDAGNHFDNKLTK